MPFTYPGVRKCIHESYAAVLSTTYTDKVKICASRRAFPPPPAAPFIRTWPRLSLNKRTEIETRFTTSDRKQKWRGQRLYPDGVFNYQRLAAPRACARTCRCLILCSIVHCGHSQSPEGFLVRLTHLKWNHSPEKKKKRRKRTCVYTFVCVCLVTQSRVHAHENDEHRNNSFNTLRDNHNYVLEVEREFRLYDTHVYMYIYWIRCTCVKHISVAVNIATKGLVIVQLRVLRLFQVRTLVWVGNLTLSVSVCLTSLSLYFLSVCLSVYLCLCLCLSVSVSLIVTIYNES